MPNRVPRALLSRRACTLYAVTLLILGAILMTLAAYNVHHDAIQTTGGLTISAKPSSWPYYRAGILMAAGVVLAALTWVRSANEEATREL